MKNTQDNDGSTLAPVTGPAFEVWWQGVGRFYDPDTDDVPWFDKREALAELAFSAAMAQSGNYVADVDTNPSRVTFANGRIVRQGAAGLVVETQNTVVNQTSTATKNP